MTFAPDLSISPTSREMIEAFIESPSHGLMLVGSQGVGLATIANRVARSLVAADMKFVAPVDGKDIPIDQIRALYAETKTIHEDGQVVVIDDCDKMSHAAQNAFLKLLEEPPKNTYFILTTHNKHDVLPTLQSRVSIIEITNINSVNSQQLINSHNKDTGKVQQIAFLANGLPAEIIRLSDDHEYFETSAAIVRDARSFMQFSRYDRLIIAKKYASRDSALLLVEMIGKLMIFMAKRGDQSHTAKLNVVAQSVDALHENSNVKLQLTQLALTL